MLAMVVMRYIMLTAGPKRRYGTQRVNNCVCNFKISYKRCTVWDGGWKLASAWPAVPKGAAPATVWPQSL